MTAAGFYFRDRHHAGRVLAERLAHYRDQPDLLVLALPRGGVVVGFEVARALRAALDIMVVRKLGFPGHEELAMGAIASSPGGGVQVMNPLTSHRVGPAALAAVLARERAELIRRERHYRAQRPALVLHGCSVIVVDDGLATGATLRAALVAVSLQQPQHLAVAVPVGGQEICAALRQQADEVICAEMPKPFHSIGRWYQDFAQTTDTEVCSLLQQARREYAMTTSMKIPADRSQPPQ